MKEKTRGKLTFVLLLLSVEIAQETEILKTASRKRITTSHARSESFPNENRLEWSNQWVHIFSVILWIHFEYVRMYVYSACNSSSFFSLYRLAIQVLDRTWENPLRNNMEINAVQFELSCLKSMDELLHCVHIVNDCCWFRARRVIQKKRVSEAINLLIIINWNVVAHEKNPKEYQNFAFLE